MHNRRPVVIKIGSNSLVTAGGFLDTAFLADIARQVRLILDLGWHPMLVSSGAVTCGLARLPHLIGEDNSLAERQALAAIGQADLMHHWQQAMGGQGLFAAQLLLTGEDFHHRESYLNVRSALNCLFDMRAVPIINENDPVSARGVGFGDNDRLSALVASMLEAERLIIATDIPGVYDKDPRDHQDAQLIHELPSISHDLVANTGGAGSRGRGGMRSKIEAAALATQAGVQVHIASAREQDLFIRLLADEPLGTLVHADEEVASSRRHWVANARVPSGTITVDSGAVQALVEDGSSLLPVGITAVDGSFCRGDTVAIADARGRVVARGLSTYSDEDLRLIMGKRRAEAVQILGRTLPKAAVHRDDLLVAPVIGGSPATD